MNLRWAGVALIAGVVLWPAPAGAVEPPDTVGVVDETTGMWFLRDGSGGTTSFYFGDPGDVPFVGDWDCDGVDTPGLYRQSDGFVYLRNTNTQGVADVTFFFGNPSDVPLAGDFDGDGCDTVSIYRPTEARFYIINTLGSDGGGLGAADSTYLFGDLGDQPFVADFDGNGTDTVGLHRSSTGLVYYRNRHTQGTADGAFVYGNPGDRMVSGVWASGGPGASDTVGLYRPSVGAFYLRNSNTAGNADVVVEYGNRVMAPIAGSFGALEGTDDPPPRSISLDVVAREAWGAQSPVVERMTAHTIEELTVHHAGDQSIVTGPQRYRAWQAWHLDRGWGDLAYHYIIGVDGTVYEGRDTRYAGDTGTNYDPTGHFLVVVEGNFEVDVPTRAQLDSLVTVLAWAAEEFGVSPGTISGHRDHAATACPGGNLYPYIASGDLEADVRAALGSG